MICVDEVHADGVMPHPHLASASLRRIYVDETQLVRAAMLVDANCLHARALHSPASRTWERRARISTRRHALQRRYVLVAVVVVEIAGGFDRAIGGNHLKAAVGKCGVLIKILALEALVP